MSYFPSLYHDETLYSGLARYHQRVGGLNQKDTLIELFGTNGVCAVTDLPGHLNKLSAITGGVYPTEKLLSEHTLYPYYSAFLSEEAAHVVKMSMIATDKHLGKAQVLVGLPASTVKFPANLRFCAACVKDDTRKFGEPYWHRIHQVPGVYVCPEHQEYLHNSTVAYTSRHHKHQFVPLSNAINSSTTIEKLVEERDFRHLLYISKESSTLLESGNPFVTINNLHNIYLSGLQSREFMTIDGHYRFREIISEFKLFYGEKILEILYCPVDVKYQDSWIHKLFRQPQSVTHPLRHLLLLGFLNIPLQRLNCGTANSYHPFGKNPWPCLNKAAEHYKQEVVEQCIISRCSKSLKPIGTFSCKCGFVYARKGPDKRLEDRYRVGRIKRFGDVWNARLLELASNNKLSCRQIGKELNVHSQTVKRQLQLSKLFAEMNVSTDFTEFEVERLRRREILNEVIDRMPGSSRSVIRRHASKEYTWLYRHDKQWLMEQLPTNQLRRLPPSRVNWNERDQFLHTKLIDVLREILEESPPIRVTLTELGKRSGQYVWLEKRIDQLPICQQFINENRETTEQFQIRRLKWAKKQLLDQFGTVSGWRLLRLAGISSNISSEIFDAIINIVEPYDERFVEQLLRKKEAC